MLQPSLNITSLLNSLHTHLQSQTSLLPTLHAQLGLPPTALADELTTLQQQLTQCVESQVNSRRKQVEEWSDKCSELEQECIRYANALGGNVKATGTSVADFRKESVLPKRHQMLNAYQEKLRQLYHTKLEQLSTLTNRITLLARTLGPDFYPSDILNPTSANDADRSNSVEHRDVTPERFSKLEKELVRGKGEVAKRLSQLHASMIQIDWLYTELGIVHPLIDELPPIASSSSASTSNGSGSSLAIPSFPRSMSSCSNISSSSDPFMSSTMSTPTPASRSERKVSLLFHSSTFDEPPPSDIEYQRIFAQFVHRLEQAEEEAPNVGLEGVEPTPGLLAWAAATRADLEDVKRRREAHIQAMYDQLEGLWKRLGVSETEMDGFVEANRGSMEATVRAYEEELESMLELKRERMGTFVANAREEIVKLWDELMIGEEERAGFAPFFDDEHTEELLVTHEEEIKGLKEERRIKAPLLASLKKYFEICEEEKELASAASDQSRLLGRGSRDPGRLLREEKMRKRVTKEKPRLEQDLVSSIAAWEAQAGRPFLVNGQPILRMLMETVNASSNDKENKRKPNSRGGSVPPRSKTPSNAGYTNGSNHNYGSSGSGPSSRGAVTPAIRPGSSLGSSHSNKRARLGDSTSTYNNQHSGYAPRGGPLGTSVGPGSNRSGSPTKSGLPVKTSHIAAAAGYSSLPRPAPIGAAKPATQHYALGHGRNPSSLMSSQSTAPSGYGVYSRPSASVSTLSVSTSTTRGNVVKKAARARRESFKPRASVDCDAAGGSGRWGYVSVAGVKEEED